MPVEHLEQGKHLEDIFQQNKEDGPDIIIDLENAALILIFLQESSCDPFVLQCDLENVPKWDLGKDTLKSLKVL